MQTTRGALMAGDQLPVLTLDFDDEKIRQLNEIAEKFKAALGMGPGGFPATVPGGGLPVPGDNHRPKGKGGKEDSGFDKFLKNLNKEAQGTLKTFSLINKTLSATTSTLKGLFTTTLSWGVKIAALSVAGPFGYSMLARSVSDTYRSSQGMNISTGQKQAAENVYGTRFSGASSMIQTLAAAQNDPQNPAYAGLVSLGIDPKEGAAENMPKLLSRVADLLKQYKKTGVSQSVLNGMGLGSLIDSTTANQVLANSDRLPMLNQQYSEQSKQLDSQMGKGTQESYQGVYANVSYNADQIGNTFLKALSRLNGPITQLSDSLTASIQKFISGKNGKALFDSIAGGLEKLANWLGGDAFQKDLDTFTTAIKNIVIAIGDAIRWIASFSPSGTGTGKDEAAPALVKFGDKYLDGKLPGANPMTNKYTGIFTEEAAREKYQMPDGLKGNIQNFVKQANNAAGLPSGLMSAIAEKESSWNPLVLNKGSGAAGLFQFIPSTAKAYGLEGDDVFDPNKATIAAAKYLQDNMKRYHGDIAKTLTQYNGGRIDKQGNLNLNKETIDYLIKILPQVQGGVEQHPGIMWQLSEARGNLAKAGGDARANIKLDINQMPGSDISAQVKGIYYTTQR